MGKYSSSSMESMPSMPNVSKKGIMLLVSVFIGVVVLFMLPKMAEDVNNSKIVINQAPFTGTMHYWTTPGLKGQWFGTITEYYKTQQLWFGAEIDSVQQGTPIPVTFNDASDGNIYGSLRVKLPTDPKYLSKIQTDYNGMDRLMNDLVRQTLVKVIYASGPLMSAFESYAEKKNDLIQYITDQLKNGVYKTHIDIVETTDPLTGEVKQNKIASLVADANAPGGYARTESSPFATYGLEVGQVSVTRIGYSEKVKKQIDSQQEQNMAVQTARAKALRAQQEAITSEEEGRAAATQAKWAQEKEKAIAVTKAEQERETSRLAAEKAEFDKKRIIAEGEAEAAAARAKVAAGLTPSEKAEWDYKTKVGIAAELSKIKLPSVVMSNGGGSTTMESAVGMKMILDMADKLSN